MTEPNADTLIQLVNLEFRSRLALRGFSRPEIIVIRAAYEDAKSSALSAWLGAQDDDGRREVKKMRMVTRVLLVEPGVDPIMTGTVTVEGGNPRVFGVENTTRGNAELSVLTDDSQPTSTFGVKIVQLSSAAPGELLKCDVPDGYTPIRVVEFDSGRMFLICCEASAGDIQALVGVVESSQ